MPKKRKGFIKPFFKRGFLFLEIIVLLPLLILLLTNQVIRLSVEDHLFDSIDKIPYNRVALVLGTSHRVKNGGPNPYFHHRMQAAADLYHNHKVSYLLLSGDNSTPYYNEPGQMRQALLALGVPAEAIYKDHAGLRTLDSVLRAQKVFGQDSITIVSQKFHNQRAIYIAKHHGIQATAYNAADTPRHRNDRTRVREWFAKANVFWDILINKQPLELDEAITIGQQ